MKKYYIIMLLSIITIACSDDDVFDGDMDLINDISRSTFEVTPDYIEQLCNTGIPTHISLPQGSANTKEMFMSGRRDSNRVILHGNNQGTGQEVYYFEKGTKVGNKQYYRIKASGGVYNDRFYVGDETAYWDPVLWNPIPTGLYKGDWELELDPITNKYLIKGVASGRYLQVKDFNSPYLKLDKTIINKAFALWDIVPTTSMELIDVTYDKNTTYYKHEKDGVFSDLTYANNYSNVPQMAQATFTSKAITSSSFSRTEGISKNITTNISVTGIPMISAVGVSTSISQNNSWTFGTSENKDDTRSYNFPIVVPPNTQLQIKVIVDRYHASLKYIATYNVIGIEKKIQLEGIWDGISADKIYYEIYNNNQLVRTLNNIPTEPVYLD